MFRCFLSFALMAAISALPTQSWADSDDQRPPQKSKAPWLNVETTIDFDASGEKSSDYQDTLEITAEVTLEALIREGVKAVIELRLEQVLREKGSKVDLEELDWEEIVEAAFIELNLNKLTGLPEATLIFGKSEMAFGQEMDQRALYRKALLHELGEQEGVIGMTLSLPVNFLQVIDQVAVSVFEAGEEDLRIASEAGGAIRFSKAVTDQIQLQVSALLKQKTSSSANEKRISIGFIYGEEDADLQAWSQLIIVDEAEEFPNARYGVQLGGALKAGPGLVVVDYQLLQKYAHEVSLSYRWALTDQLTLSPEIVKRWELDGSGMDEVRIGARIRYQSSLQKPIRIRRR